MSDIEDYAREVRALIKGEVSVHELMKRHTTFHIGGSADIFALPESSEDISLIVDYARTNGIPHYIIGNGSNLLIADDGIRGIVVKIGRRMSGMEFDGETVKLQAGVSLSRLSRIAAEHGLSGLEYAVGIPGTVGGAVVMNAGSGDQDTGQIVTCVKVIGTQGEITEVKRDESDFSYRDSRFKHSGEIVLMADFRLQNGERGAIEEKMKSLMDRRRKTTPLQYPSAGSIFRNPEGDSAGRLIDQAGCKDMKRGDAQVSGMHANWIVNLGKAKGSDVLELMSIIQDRVQKKFGVQLKPEIRILPFPVSLEGMQ